MAISAEIIADSVSRQGKRITTLQLKYPRFIHAELMTHRVFSRNASSSRAIPVRRLIASIISDPAKPVHWGKNQPGMQADEQLTGVRLWLAKAVWFTAMWFAIAFAWLMHLAGGHKQIVNRILEPFSHIHVIVTATEWDNFFELRDHKDAQPEIKALARAMRGAMLRSTPRTRKPGKWHLPYISFEDWVDANRLSDDLGLTQLEIVIRASVARCARVSYYTHDGRKPDIKTDLKLYDRLVGSRPLHASPAEHQAVPAEGPNAQCRNFVGWVQHRAILEAAGWTNDADWKSV